VTGIEQIPEAIEDAKLNAALNGVTNCNFYAGDVRMILNEAFLAQHGRADVIVTDPAPLGYAYRCGRDIAIDSRAKPNSVCELQCGYSGARLRVAF
jgi:tRNA/tmRNA/rRNA uracil-C5-methylase (TrmA/RlmC/RlmD family)